ncbi:nucleoside 5-triphosphatase RdgB [Halalkalibacter wakoensis JCM 9140]|uniref:Nucleoside 5-triphosphatase RdgB n=1 Tax=Halalkalibacter wakoensis JCM 9140 TaxID=1236970 RepID=W4Q479_9BACI|nr:nucleoside 5-triphosphatase RdgB [Halalkalibacter wakoensis JCM 9140]
MRKVLAELVDVPAEDRSARFICVMAVSRPNEQTLFYEGTCEGIIAQEAIGSNGFGYDPIFYVPKHEKTMAELSPEEKNNLSHRANAINKLLTYEHVWNV